MSMVNVVPEDLYSVGIPGDISSLELTEEDIEVRQAFRVEALGGVFVDHPDWRQAAEWQASSLDDALNVLAQADVSRDEPQRAARLSGLQVDSLHDSTIVVRWPYADKLLGVEVTVFGINDHTAVSFDGNWWLNYRAPQTDDINELTNGFWTELWGVCSTLRAMD